jgi:glyceraldehyde 3-phosphate dehydrogenase
MSDAKTYDSQLEQWISEEKLGVNLLNSVGTLMYDKGIELVLFRKHLLEVGVSELMNLFSYANNIINRKIDVQSAFILSEELLKMDLMPSKLDIGLLTAEYLEKNSTNPNEFLKETSNTKLH